MRHNALFHAVVLSSVPTICLDFGLMECLFVCLFVLLPNLLWSSTKIIQIIWQYALVSLVISSHCYRRNRPLSPALTVQHNCCLEFRGRNFKSSLSFSSGPNF